VKDYQCPDDGAIFRGNLEKFMSRHDAASPRHILHDHDRIARNVFPQMTRHRAAQGSVPAAGRRANH
jgi:hypothetical protein